MGHLWIPDIPVAEKILRAAVVYFFIILAFRMTGKRQVGQLSPFDLTVLLIVSNVVQNAMIGSDNSLGGGLIGAATIFILNYLFVELAYRFKKIRNITESSPTVLIHNGRVLQKNLNKERVTMDELRSALRKNGVLEPAHVRYAILEENGQISVVPFGK